MTIRIKRDSLGRAEIMGSVWDDIKDAFSPAKKIAQKVWSNPAGKAATVSLFGPQTAAVAAISAAAASSRSRPKKQEIEKPSDSQRSAIPASESGMGADAPLTDAQIMKHIKREPNPLKRKRMILNLQRAQARR